MRLAWYWSRLFWGGLLGIACLLFVWGYKLEAPAVYRIGWTDVEGSVGVGEGRVSAQVQIRTNRADPFSALVSGFAVEEKSEYFGALEGAFAPAMEIQNYPAIGSWTVVVGHWLLVAIYGIIWLGALVWWHRRKRRLVGPVSGRAGWKRIAIPVVGIAVMAVAMTRREVKAPATWDYAFRGHGREVWKQLNEDGMVTAEEIIGLCYQQGSHHDGDRMLATALALAGHQEDPIPVLRKMMGEAVPERRAFAALTAGYLGDVRMRPDLEGLRGDMAPLGVVPGDWFWETVGEAAEDALKSMDRGGLGKSPKEVRQHFGSWLKLGEIR